MSFAMYGKASHAPVTLTNPISILDVGTGSGLWARDMAVAYPHVRVIGIDLLPIQWNSLPSNLHFIVDDLENAWRRERGPFDLVHTRGLNSIGIRDWSEFFEQAFASLQHGGFVECQQLNLEITSDDQTIPVESKMMQWAYQWEEGLRRAGLAGRCYPDRLVQQMRAAGFTNIQFGSFKMPIGPWPEDSEMAQAGQSNKLGLLGSLHSLSARPFLEHLENWNAEELEGLLAQVRAEVNRTDMHAFFPIYVVYGQKPLLSPTVNGVHAPMTNRYH